MKKTGLSMQEDEMFKDAIIRRRKNIRLNAIVLPVSFLAHALVALLAVVFPNIKPGELPEIEVHNVFVAPPPPLAPLPPPGKKGSRSSPGTRIRPVPARANTRLSQLIAPFKVPDEILDEWLPGFGSDPGIDGGIDGGADDGIWSAIAGDVLRSSAGDDLPPMRAMGEIRPPRILKQVRPVYPEIARSARVEGVVVVEATTDIYGRVVEVKILRSIPLLDQAAVDAVSQYVFEPMVINGKPRSVVFTLTVKFRLT